MAHLTLAGLSEDGKRLLLIDDSGQEFTLSVDDSLRAALRGDHARIGQLEIHMESTLRPREIQDRIRAGQTPEAVAQAAQTSVEKIMPFAGPVLAERSHIAQRAQTSSVRRRSGDHGARTLGESVAAQLRELNIDPDTVEWDAYRREDGRWHLSARFDTPDRSGDATFVYDLRGNFVTIEDDDARWLVGEHVGDAPDAALRAAPEPAPDAAAELAVLDSADQPGPPTPRRRLSAVPADQLPWGEDALEVAGAASQSGGPVDAPEHTESSTETTIDFADQPVEAYLPGDEATAQGPSQDPEVTQLEQPAEEERRLPRRRERKSRGRASVPSWDEIMFGGPKD